MFDILEMRAFRDAKDAIDRDGDKVKMSRMVVQYLTIEGRRTLDRHKAQAAKAAT